jgi:hypothetical protein
MRLAETSFEVHRVHLQPASAGFRVRRAVMLYQSGSYDEVLPDFGRFQLDQSTTHLPDEPEGPELVFAREGATYRRREELPIHTVLEQLSDAITSLESG